MPEARDEYHSYLPQIVQLLRSGADEHQLAGHLTEIATVRMGLEADVSRDRHAAEILSRWHNLLRTQALS